jgi:hypothetical protein
VNVFKLCDVDQLKDVYLQGDVTEHMVNTARHFVFAGKIYRGVEHAWQDRIIGKKVFRVRGTIPANNYIQLPKQRSKTLGLYGQYIYIQVRPCMYVGTCKYLHNILTDLYEPDRTPDEPSHPLFSCWHMQIKATPVKVFVIHLEVVTQDQIMHRMSISNMWDKGPMKVRY